jgi:hypothetical protein
LFVINQNNNRFFKKFFFFFFTFLLVFTSCKKKGCRDPFSLSYDNRATKDDGSCTYPENDRKSLIYYSTATWCQYCGDIGKDFVDDISIDFPNSQVISLHKNDVLTSDISFLTQAYLDSVNGQFGCPHFYLALNSVVQPSYSPNNFNQLKSAVNGDLLLFSKVNLDLEYSINGNMMNVKVQSKLATNVTDDNFYLSTYILEDAIVSEQNVLGTYSPNFIHNNVLRKEVSDYADVFGTPLIFNQNGDNLTSFYEIPLDSTSNWNYNNLYVVAVVWQKIGDNFNFINLEK